MKNFESVLTRIFLVLILFKKSLSSSYTSSSQSSGHCYSTSCLDKTKTSTEKTVKLTETQEFLGNYSFPIYPVPVVSCRSVESLRIIERAEPVILKGCHLAEVTKKWSLQYMETNILSQELSIYVSAHRIFRFFRERLNTGKYPFRRPHILKFGNFSTFLKLMKEIEKADNGSRIYLVSKLESSNLTAKMQDDVFMFDLAWINAIKRRFQWEDHVLNLFTVGMPDVITPVHFDILENIFLQIHGKKHCILFHPDNYKYLYPYPIHHPHDRHGQVNLEEIDFEKFPKAKSLEGWEAILEPGDVLYIPIYWWHHFVSWRKSYTVSYNFWFRPTQTPDFLKVYAPEIPSKTEKSDKPLPSWMSLGLTRKVERMVAEFLKDPSAVGTFLREMVEGTFDPV